MSKGRTLTFVFIGIVTALPLFGVVYGLLIPQDFERAQEVARDYLLPFGVWAPLAFVALQALQVVLTPINHYVVGMAGGFLYGPYLGAFLNWVGRVIGHLIAFALARLAREKIALRFVKPETMARYDRLISNKSGLLFLAYFLPVFPDDELSYIAGLSKMPFKRFFLANFFGQIGGSLGLAYLGAGINTRDPLFWIIFAVTLVCFAAFFFLWRENKKAGVESSLLK